MGSELLIFIYPMHSVTLKNLLGSTYLCSIGLEAIPLGLTPGADPDLCK